MSGRTLMIALIGFSILFGAALWWFQTHGHYRELVNDVVLTHDGFVEVTDYSGIDADSSPLKLRACFTAPPLSGPAPERPDPLVAPGWFDCFDAETLAKDIGAEKARAFLAESNEPYGFDRIIAQYPDGRAFEWRQINKCGKAEFAGDPLPDGCPEPPKKD